jgi:acetolactate synthase-1/2/3 large subunit
MTALARADVVLVLDTEVPWVPLQYRPPDEARVIQIDIDPVKPTLVNWGFSIDLPIQADSQKALSQLCDRLAQAASPQQRQRWADRLGAVTRSTSAARRDRAARVARSAGERPISPHFAVATLDQVLSEDAIVLEEATTNELVVREYLQRARPGTIFAIGAAGLGWVMGAAMGAKLANPAADVVGICGDGSFLFSSPVSALWAARDAGAPFLTVILDNGGYRASKNPVQMLFPDGASVRADDFTGTVLDQRPDYARLAQACAADGIRVEDPGELAGAFQRALAAVRAGRCAVVDVILEGI